MTEGRMQEIKAAALDIIACTADLQMAVLYGGQLQPETANHMFASLQGIKDMANSMLRANGTRFDPEERARLACLNTLNALRAQLDHINTKNTLDDLNLYKLAAILENAQAKVKGYVLLKSDAQAEDLAVPGICFTSKIEAA